MSEQPNSASREAPDEPGSATTARQEAGERHARTDEEISVDDALGAQDDPR
jgi:hypothetical protein